MLQRALPARVCTAPSLPGPAWPCRRCPRRHRAPVVLMAGVGRQISPRLSSVRCWGRCQAQLELCHPRACCAGAPVCASRLPRAPRLHAAAVSLPWPQHRQRGARHPAPTCSWSIFNSPLRRPCPAHGTRGAGEEGKPRGSGTRRAGNPVPQPSAPRLQGEGHPEQGGRRARRCWELAGSVAASLTGASLRRASCKCPGTRCRGTGPWLLSFLGHWGRQLISLACLQCRANSLAKRGPCPAL